MWDKGKVKYILPVIHVILSFFYERLILDFSNDSSVVLSIPMGGVSFAFESALTYIIAKVIAVAMIICVWKVLFFLFDGGLKQTHIRCFVAFFFMGLLVCVICFPDMFLLSEDNLITYAYAVKLQPEYWHSVYSSAVYAACLMVAPFKLSINILQWFGFVCSLSYLFHRLSGLKHISTYKKCLIFIILLIPDTFFIIGNGYRTEQYAILCMFYMSLVVMDIIEKKKRSVYELVLLSVLSAFISVWRSEGAILGILGYFSLMLFVYKAPVIEKVCLSILVLIMFFIVSVPQKLGNDKFYGSDYSFINSFPTLHNIICAPSSNLLYDGGKDDIEAIKKVVPLDMLAVYGMEGYRKYNFANGRPDINQSMAGETVSKAYMQAYYRMVFHNPIIYAKTQISFLLQALKIRDYAYIEHNLSVPMEKDYADYNFSGWDTGRKLYLANISGWQENTVRKSISDRIIGAFNAYMSFLSHIYVYSLIFICAVLFEIYIFFREFINFCKKKYDKTGFAAFSFVLLGQAAAILLVMPAGVMAYFHAFFYCTFILDLTYIISVEKVAKEQ